MRLRAVIFLIVPTLLLVLAACGPKSRPERAPQLLEPTFAGNAACAECHPQIHKVHGASRHALALRFVDVKSLGKDAPPLGAIPESDVEVKRTAEGLVYGPKGQDGMVLDVAFGSGKSGMAFVALRPNETMAEAHWSWLPALKKWFVTPGQRVLPDGVPGNITKGPPTRQCIGCHVVTLPKNTLVPERKFLGVGCESCHGAGGEHVLAMKAGDMARGKLEKLGKLPAHKLNDRCGTCHRTEKDVIDNRLDRQKTDLFQAYGLTQSRCFREGGKSLSCISCHNPHQNVSENEKTYTKVCVSCHSTPKKVCPKNPTANCTGCHMPRRPEPLFDGSPRTMADHFIRIWRGGEMMPTAIPDRMH